jgi:hypothetical protein
MQIQEVWLMQKLTKSEMRKINQGFLERELRKLEYLKSEVKASQKFIAELKKELSDLK